MIVIRTAIVIWCLVALALSAAIAGEESCRIRIRNKESGLVQVSLDKGKKWATVGRVTSPANARIVGFAASSYVPHASVAATAVHGIRIKTGQYSLGVGKSQRTMLFSIEPLEFAKKPSGFGGHTSRSSGIYTDIYTGRSIFRNQSPYVGNSVYIERDHSLHVLPGDYTPIEGDVYVIISLRPDKAVSSIEFENKADGRVIANYCDGSASSIAEVVRPVKGVGRYDATTFTGIGAVNTNHGGVLTISTAPIRKPMTREGEEEETRGGFMVQPVFHAAEQGERSPQVMVIGPIKQSSGKEPVVEGTEPLFFGNINLSRYESDAKHSFRAEVRIDSGEWEQMPKIIGRVDDAFTANYLNKYFAADTRKITSGVTAIRLLFPEYDSSLLASDLAREAQEYSKRVTDIRRVSGTTIIKPAKAINAQTLVEYYLDGYPVYTCSGHCAWHWDTAKTSNGLHEIEIIAANSVERRVVMVANPAGK